MAENGKVEQMFEEVREEVLPQAELVRFYTEVGREVVELARMLQEPTEARPFVYELRLDLWPASNTAGMAIIKGFGASESLIAFQEGSGLVGLLRGIHGRLRSGKMNFSVDKFEPANYEKRVKDYRKEKDYLSAKLKGR